MNEQNQGSTMTQDAEPVSFSDSDRREFSNAVLFDWDAAMDRFFNRVDNEREKRGLSPEQAHLMLSHGYGDDIAEAWDEWFREGEL